MVVIAIPSMDNGGLNDKLNPRFGRCPCFTFVELENNNIKSVKILSNYASKSMGGAGIQAAQIVGENKAEVLIIGFLGPNADKAIKAFNIKVFEIKEEEISIKNVVDLYIKGQLKELISSNVNSHNGMEENIPK